MSRRFDELARAAESVFDTSNGCRSQPNKIAQCRPRR